MKSQSQKEKILETLREKGFRITKQRKTLIDIILENECSSCKEIFYKAVDLFKVLLLKEVFLRKLIMNA